MFASEKIQQEILGTSNKDHLIWEEKLWSFLDAGYPHLNE